ncbi:hypothetical protein VN1339_07570 [Helicobacter pylori]
MAHATSVGFCNDYAIIFFLTKQIFVLILECFNLIMTYAIILSLNLKIKDT